MKIKDIDFPKPPQKATHARIEVLGGGVAHTLIKSMDTFVGTSGKIYYGSYKYKSSNTFEKLAGPFNWDGEKIT